MKGIKQKGVPSFPTVDGVIDAQRRKALYEPADLYMRDSSYELTELESHMESLAGADPGHLLLYNSGMSAVVDALELGFPASGTVVVHGNQLYSQSQSYLQEYLPRRGIKSIGVDAGSLSAIAKALQVRKPQIVFMETVSNGSDMQVLDVEGFLRLPELEDPLIILDNTLPSCALPLYQTLKDSDKKIIVIESGTKFYSQNRELSGLIYAYNKELLQKLRERRRTTGSLLSVSAVETIRQVIPSSKEDFDSRNRRILLNTFGLARICFEMEKGRDFIVAYPNLPSHPNSKLANSRFLHGSAPVFFIHPTDLGRFDQYDLTRSLWQNETIQEFCDLGQSFGFDRTRIWPDQNYPVIRIAGGIENEEKMQVLKNAFQEVLLGM